MFIHAAHTDLVSSKALGASVAASLTLPGTFCNSFIFVVGLFLRDWAGAGVVCVNDVRLTARFIQSPSESSLGSVHSLRSSCSSKFHNGQYPLEVILVQSCVDMVNHYWRSMFSCAHLLRSVGPFPTRRTGCRPYTRTWRSDYSYHAACLSSDSFSLHSTPPLRLLPFIQQRQTSAFWLSVVAPPSPLCAPALDF